MAMNELELKRFLEQKLVEIGSVMMEYYNCCDIHGSACRAGDPNPCCHNTGFGRGLCPFWMFRKCQFNNSDCKLWICKTAISATDPVCVEGLLLLEKFAKLFGLARDPLIGRPYSGADRQPVEIPEETFHEQLGK